MKQRKKKMICIGISAVMAAGVFFTNSVTEFGYGAGNAALPTQAYIEISLMQAPSADSGMQAVNGTAVVNGGTVNVRSGPSTAYGVLGTVKRGNKVGICGKFSNGWVKIIFRDGYGYMTSQYLEGFRWESNATPFAATAVTTDNLNVRAGNGTNYDKLGLLPQGTTVKITGKFDNGWYEIEYQGGKGCVIGEYLKDIRTQSIPSSTAIVASSTTPVSTAAPSTTQKPVQELTPMDATAVTTANLNVRAGNATRFEKLGTLPKGTKVRITGVYSNQWYQIVYAGGTGAVCGDYLKEIQPVEKPTTTQPSTQPEENITVMDAYGTTTANLNLRRGNGTQYEILALIPKGTRVRITGRYANQWYRVAYQDKTGCVSGEYLKDVVPVTQPTEPATSVPATAPEEPATVPAVRPEDVGMEAYYARGETTDNLNVRKGPSTSYDKLGVIPNGSAVGIIGRFPKTNWYKIVYESGYGYVCADYITRIVPVDNSGLYMDVQELTLRVNVSRKLRVYSLFAQGGAIEAKWKSSAPEIVTVDRDGKVTAIAKGSAVITAEDPSGSGSVSCKITVLNYKESAKISGIPVYNQLTAGYPTGCEQFSARMLVNFYGYRATAQDMVNAITLSSAPYTKNKVKYGGDPSRSFVGDPKKKKPLGYGCLPSAIAAGINRYMAQVGGSYQAVDISGCGMDTIYSYISQGIPVLAASAYLPSVNNPVKVKEWTWIVDSGPNKGQSVTWWRSRHVMVIVGYDANYIYVNDPCFNTQQKFNKKDWVDDWNRVDRHTLVMLKK